MRQNTYWQVAILVERGTNLVNQDAVAARTHSWVTLALRHGYPTAIRRRVCQPLRHKRCSRQYSAISPVLPAACGGTAAARVLRTYAQAIVREAWHWRLSCYRLDRAVLVTSAAAVGRHNRNAVR